MSMRPRGKNMTSRTHLHICESRLPPITARSAIRFMGRGVALVVLSMSLGGCLSKQGSSLTTSSINPVHAERHPISVHTGSVELKVELVPRMSSLGAGQRSQIGQFLGGYKSIGAGQLAVISPRGRRNRTAASNVVGEIRQMMAAAGVPARAVGFGFYSPEPGTVNPPVVMKYNRYFATPSACGDWSDDVAETSDNVPYNNFACAQQNNLAAMVANPRDLIAPRAMTPADIERRVVVYSKYIKGETTAAKRSSDEKSTVADVGNSE